MPVCLLRSLLAYARESSFEQEARFYAKFTHEASFLAKKSGN